MLLGGEVLVGVDCGVVGVGMVVEVVEGVE